MADHRGGHKEIASILDANGMKRDDEMVRRAIEKLELDTIRRMNAAAAQKRPDDLSPQCGAAPRKKRVDRSRAGEAERGWR